MGGRGPFEGRGRVGGRAAAAAAAAMVLVVPGGGRRKARHGRLRACPDGGSGGGAACVSLFLVGVGVVVVVGAGADRAGLVGGGVAEEGVGEADELLGEALGGGGGVGARVGEAVADRLEARRVGVADPRHLRGGKGGERKGT